MNAANHRLLVLIEEFDRRNGWVGWGLRSCAHWLSWKCGIGLVAAREKVRVARALVNLPTVSEAMRVGKLSRACYEAALRSSSSVGFGALFVAHEIPSTTASAQLKHHDPSPIPCARNRRAETWAI